MSERTNEHLAHAVRAADREDTEVALAYALIALVQEVAQLREVLEDGLAPHGAIAGFLDEVAVRLAPAGDSISEAIVSASARGGDDL